MEKMKALVYLGPRDMRYMDVDKPEPGPDEVLISVKAVSICGSDTGGYKGGNPMRTPPLIMGHEFCGRVVALGKNVKDVPLDARVIAVTNLYCNNCPECAAGLPNICSHRRIIGTTMPGGPYNGAMADYVVAPAEKLIFLDDRISDIEAALAEPLAIALRAVGHAGDLKDKTVLICGAGPIGLLTLICAKHSGAETLIVTDLVEDRLKMARDCGADHTLCLSGMAAADAVRTLTDGVGADVVFDAVGVADTLNGGIEAVRNGGLVVWIGLAAQLAELEYKHAVCKEIRFQGSYMYIDEMHKGIALIQSGVLDVARIVTGIYPMSDGPKIFEELVSGQSKDIKVILTNN